MMLLGGGAEGEDFVMQMCTQATPKTVVGYLKNVIAGGAGAKLPNPLDFLINANAHNPTMPKNLHLLCGDGNLEPMAPAISAAAAAPALTPSSQPWKWIHLIFKGLIDSTAKRWKDKDLTVFIDTNPSFSIYTELAISAADKLITPVNADDSSRTATNAMFILLHGQVPPHPIYGSWTFATKAQQHALDIPKIHVIVGNRLTQYEGAATAFSALSDATTDSLFQAHKTHPSYFTPRTKPAKTLLQFRSMYSVALRDFNTAGVVAAHFGCPLSKLQSGYHKIHNNDVKVNAERIADCIAALDELLLLVD